MYPLIMNGVVVAKTAQSAFKMNGVRLTTPFKNNSELHNHPVQK